MTLGHWTAVLAGAVAFVALVYIVFIVVRVRLRKKPDQAKGSLAKEREEYQKALQKGVEVLYTNREEMFSVSRERGGDRRYFLDVVCGGFAMFEQRLEMNDEEVGWFRHDAQQLMTLVRQVRHWPDRFTGRLRNL